MSPYDLRVRHGNDETDGTLHLGRGTDSTRPPLLLVHGAGGASRMWKPAVRLLDDRFHVIAPDLPGFGESSGTFTLDEAVRQLGDALAPFGPAVVFGASLGGTVALQLAATHPDLVDRLIVSGAAIAPSERPLLVQLYAHVPDRLARYVSDVRGGGWRALVREIATIDVRSQLNRIAAPTLVVRGAHEYLARRDADELAARIPNARLWIAPHLGHNWMVYAPKLLNDVISGFV